MADDTKPRMRQHVQPLLKVLANHNFTGYVEADDRGTLTITIPGVASLYEMVGERPLARTREIKQGGTNAT